MNETEADFSRWFEDLLTLRGYRWTHFRPAQIRSGRYVTALSGAKGFPDYAIVGKGRFLLVELKAEGKYPTVEQRAWRDDLLAAGADYRLWRPADREVIMEVFL